MTVTTDVPDAPEMSFPAAPHSVRPATHPMPHPVRHLRLHAAVARRCVRRYGFQPAGMVRRLDERSVFVVGSPRSGTSFTAEAIGEVRGFADLGEVNALKAAVPALHSMPIQQSAPRLRRTLVVAQRLGMVAGRRVIEQTPESTYLMPAIARAFPQARFVHLLRDPRDVVCSLIERGWLRDGTAGVSARATGTTADDAGQPFGQYVRFWVEPELREQFEQVSEARRAAWAWRRYTEAALTHTADLELDRVLRIRYEQLVREPRSIAAELAAFLDADDRTEHFETALGAAHAGSLGRWQRDLTKEQLADVEREAGELMRELGYEW